MRRFISLLMIGLLVFITTASTSCDRTETPVEVANQESSNTEMEVKQQEMEEYNAQFFALVEKIEPYVTTNKNGTWTIDWQSFDKSNSNLSAKENSLLSELKIGLSLANETVLEPPKAPNESLSYWVNYYWWGRKACFTGREAYIATSLFTTGSGVAGFNPINLGLAFLAEYYRDTYGGFCLYQTWVGGVWMTHV